MSKAAKQSGPKYAAPGQYLGYSLQPVRLCYHLLTCPAKASVSLEMLDDVAVHFADGRVLLEQTKSALSQNPLSDWAADLWKCLANWSGSISTKSIDVEQATFQLYVTPVKSGSVALELSSATDEVAVEKVFQKIRASLKLMERKPGSLAHIKTVLEATQEVRGKFIARFQVISCDADPLNPIRELLNPTVAPELIDLLCHFAIGRAKETADKLIRDGNAAMISGDSFKTEFRNFVQRNNLPSILTSLNSTPSTTSITSLLNTHPTFVQQLDLVEVDQDERVRAVSDFLRAAADKSTWSEAGQIFEDGLKEWDDELLRRHTLVRGEAKDVHGDKDAVTRGRIVYRQSARMEPPLEGRAVPSHFVHGCLNALADKKTIGWHPDYESLLREEGK